MKATLGIVGMAILVMASTSSAGDPAMVHYVANEGFLIEGGAKKLLIDALFDDGGFEKVDVDIAFLEYFDWSEETRAILDRRMNADRTVFMHLPPEPEKIEVISRRLELTFPNPVIFDTPLQIREF